MRMVMPQMMEQRAKAQRRQFSRQRLERLATELLAPAPTATILILAVALHSAPSPAAALRWAVLAILFGCILPFLYIIRGVRRRQLSDHHVRVREQRPLPIVVALVSVLAGLALLVVLGAPRDLLAVVVAMAAGLIVSLLITLVWKISVHTGAVAGTVIILALVFGPWLLVLEVFAFAVGWARMELGDHTRAQVIAGGIIGALVAAVTFSLLR